MSETRETPVMEEDNEGQSLGGGKFVWSFLAIALGFFASLASVLLAMLAVTAYAFPDIFELWQADREQFERAWQQDPGQFWPASLSWSMLAANIVVSTVIGWLVAFIAPFGKRGHTWILAMLMLLTYIQMTLQNSPVPGELVLGLSISTPLFLILGGWIYCRARVDESPPGDDRRPGLD